MLGEELLQLRLANQHLARPELWNPEELVRWMGAVQAQDYLGAKWAVGQRLCDATDDVIEHAYAEGSILRTHVLRPTWHFVTPADIRWLLALTAPRVKASVMHYDRLLGLDEALYARTDRAIARALEDGEHLTRAELQAALARDGVPPETGQVMGHLLMRAELDGIVCSGPCRGKQLTYALLNERAPESRAVDAEEALAELAARYFASHGPATVRDFAWWSGLTVADANRGLELNGSRLARETVDRTAYWFAPGVITAPPMSELAYLLPNYDEYTVAYRDRDLFYDASLGSSPAGRGDSPLSHVIVVGGRVAGTWKRIIDKGSVVIQTRWFAEPSLDQRAAAAAAAQRYAAFMGLAVDFVG